MFSQSKFPKYVLDYHQILNQMGLSKPGVLVSYGPVAALSPEGSSTRSDRVEQPNWCCKYHLEKPSSEVSPPQKEFQDASVQVGTKPILVDQETQTMAPKTLNGSSKILMTPKDPSVSSQNGSCSSKSEHTPEKRDKSEVVDTPILVKIALPSPPSSCSNPPPAYSSSASPSGSPKISLRSKNSEKLEISDISKLPTPTAQKPYDKGIRFSKTDDKSKPPNCNLYSSIQTSQRDVYQSEPAS